MIRLTQTEHIHEKKEKDSSSPDDSTPAIKKEAESEPVPARSTDQTPSGTSDDCINCSKIPAASISPNASVYQMLGLWQFANFGDVLQWLFYKV